MAALKQLVSQSPVFSYASDDELLMFTQYKSALKDLALRMTALRIGTGNVLSDYDGDNFNENSPLLALKNLLHEFKGIEEAYEQYLHLEDVKCMPNVYYTWMLKQLSVFWQKMKWEVAPGNRPSRKIQTLYDILTHHMDSLPVYHEELPEGFDVIEEGHLAALLIECYEHMIIPNDITYNGTVRREGLSFMHNSVVMMPKSVLEQIVSKYPHKTAFTDYIVRSWEKYRA